jgi:hypothetical protein
MGARQTKLSARTMRVVMVPPKAQLRAFTWQHPGRPERPRKGNGGDKGPDRNKPLGFSLTLDPSHPYLAERGVPPGLAEAFGLGYCERGIMTGRVCIPIHNADGQLVAYAGRWAGSLEELPEGKGRYELPAGFRKEPELFNLHGVKHCRHLVVVEGYFGAICSCLQSSAAGLAIKRVSCSH